MRNYGFWRDMQFVSKALGSDISGLADYIARSSVSISEERLASLLRLISGEVEEYLLDVAWRRSIFIGVPVKQASRRS